MTALKECLVVHSVEWCHYKEIPSGNGPMTLFGKVLYEAQIYRWSEEAHFEHTAASGSFYAFLDQEL